MDWRLSLVMSSQFQISLERAAHGRLVLPVEAQEYGKQEYLRRRFLVCTVAALFMMLALFGIFLWAGFFPGIHRGLVTTIPSGFGRTLFVCMIALPLGVGLLLFWIMRAAAPAMVDDAQHPCRYRATEEGLTVILADSRQIFALWDAVRLQSSGEMYFKPGLTALTRVDFLVGEIALILQVPRLRPRGRRMFLRSLAKHWLAAAETKEA